MNHSGDIYPIAAVIELRLGGGTVIMQWDIQKTNGGVGGADAANPAVGDLGIVLDIDGIVGQTVRQSQDLIGIVRSVGRGVGAGRGQAAGGDPELVQVDGAGGLYVELVSGGLGEGAGADQIAVDEVVKIAVGYGDPHGDPLVFVAVVGEIS